ncbi:LLM class flavin-dependent oxidoreductase [Crossiella sp. SN42]|uniref:LLM class flavin-dependent oxidoreductase n=1 Tax=Crossiella sp. SN42 TaxID=2944808 RepID=UPI00207C54BF|nr:LLM class flavin-dependent oxidoreductase [Crossiella sp. SN42]MCO1579946.1 LLM class flavin-dependent oxidoreductase [Crossiella sp. SN42]
MSSAKKLTLGVILPPIPATDPALTVPAAARFAEELGLDGVWQGDHLAPGRPSLDLGVGLAAAAAATTRVRIGASVFVPAIRPLAWAAKLAASLQEVSGGRLVLGIGSGGGEAQWAAAGIPYAERGPRTDRALTLLPRLLSGEAVPLPDEPGTPELDLAVRVPVPPFWVGNDSPPALRRAARLGQGWFPSLVSPDRVRAGRARLAELAGDRPLPTIAVGAVSALGDEPGLADRHGIAEQISHAYQRPVAEVLSVPLTGTPAQAAEQLAAYREAGAEHIVCGFAGGAWRRQAELLAEAGRLLD